MPWLPYSGLHQAVFALLWEEPSLNNEQVARRLGCTPANVGIIRARIEGFAPRPVRIRRMLIRHPEKTYQAIGREFGVSEAAVSLHAQALGPGLRSQSRFDVTRSGLPDFGDMTTRRLWLLCRLLVDSTPIRRRDIAAITGVTTRMIDKDLHYLRSLGFEIARTEDGYILTGVPEWSTPLS